MRTIWKPEPWMAAAACSQTDPELWFPDKGGVSAAAKRICRSVCAVREPCLRFALEHNERGVWGGLSERERQGIKQREANDRDAIV